MAWLLLTVPLAVTMCACQSGVEVPIQDYHVYAAGSIDVDGDAVPDLYTVNHNAAPSILLRAKDPLPPLPHDPRFPGLVDLPEEPERPETGALVYWHRSIFKIATGALEAPLVGSVTFRDKPVVDAPVEQIDETHWRVHFSLTPEQDFVVHHDPTIAGWPISLHIESDPSMVSLGQIGDHPEADTELHLRDYHALLAKDIDHDGDTDLVAIGGGMRGRVAEFVPDAMEQTFINEGGQYVAIDGPPKLGCGNRGGRWEGDTMRLFCARGQPDNLWRWEEGQWVGGPDDYRTTGPRVDRTPCTLFVLMRHQVEIEEEEQWCVEADFDDDGFYELVVITHYEDRMSVAKYYE